MDLCAPDAASPVLLHGARRVLLLLHAAASIVLIGAATHHAREMRHYLRGRFARASLEKTYARVVAVAYAAVFVLGALLYPTYRVHVRACYLDQQAPRMAALFDVKEMFAALTLLLALGLGALSLTLRPAEERSLVPLYAATSLIVCAVVWFSVIAGLLVTSVRGIG